MSPEEKARYRRQARDRQGVGSHRRSATTARPMQCRVSVDGHQAARRAIRAACVVVSLAEGKTPEELAGEIARRAVAALCGKPEAKASGASQ